MGGECYRYCRLKKGATVTESDQDLYRSILPSVMSEVKARFETEDPANWEASFDGENALELQVASRVEDSDMLPGRIVIPKQLNSSFEVGWQHRCYGDVEDPKYDIANKIMDTFLKSHLKVILDEDQEDNIAYDLGTDEAICDALESQGDQSRGVCHYTCGFTDLDWSPNGLYGGYHDWEDYLDANGLDKSYD